MFECVSVWVCECVCECVSVWVCECVSVCETPLKIVYFFDQHSVKLYFIFVHVALQENTPR